MKRMIAFVGAVLPLALFAQVTGSGTWKGPVEVPGTQLEMVFHFNQTVEGWSGTYDVPVQRIYEFDLTDLVVSETELSFGLDGVPGDASFASSFLSADSIAGTFTQMGQAFTMWFVPWGDEQQQAAQASLNEKLEEIRLLADSLRTKHELPGLGFGVVYQGEVVLAEGFGTRNMEKDLPVTANTLFAIGSCSKAFTAMIMAMQVDQGLLDWDEPVRTYLPDFELMDDFATREMTPRDLVIHNSGLPRHDMMWYGSNQTREEIYHKLKYLKPTESFRSKFQYNNLMIMTAGYLSGVLEGTTWEELVQEKIFNALGMDGSNTSITESQQASDYAIPYTLTDGELTEIPFRSLDNAGPAGSINSSVNDMLKWVQFQLNLGMVNDQPVVSAEQLLLTHTPQMIMGSDMPIFGAMETSYGLGWMIYHDRGEKFVSHGGAIDGFLAQVHLVPEEEFGLVILTNSDSHGLNNVLMNTVTDLLIFDKPVDWTTLFTEEEAEEETDPEVTPEEPEDAVAHSHGLEEYAGTYVNEAYGSVEVIFVEEKKNNHLLFSYGNFEGTLQHKSYELFGGEIQSLGTDLEMNFYTDFNGLISELRMELEPAVDPLVFDKLPPNLLEDEAYMASVSGAYQLEGKEMRLFMENSSFYAFVAGQGKFKLVPVAENLFEIEEISGYGIEFVFDKKGNCIEMISHQPDGDYRCTKTE